MFENIQIPIDPSLLWLAQIRGRTALVFSGSQFFTALIAGVLLAFAFQFLFTNLGVAAWISSQNSKHNSRKSESFGNTIRQVSIKLGLATLISVTLALFFACLLAVRLGLFASPVSGAIAGLTIWATFLTIVLWLSTNRLGSLVASVTNAGTSGIQALVGIATAAMGAKAANKQAIATAEAAAAAVSREVGKAIDPQSLRRELEGYLKSLKSPELDTDKIATDFAQLLDRENLSDIRDRLPEFDRQTFKDLIGDRQNLSDRDLDRLARRLETIWQQKIDRQSQSPDRMTDFKTYLQSATREQLLGKEFSDKLDALIQERRQQNRSSTGTNPMTQSLTLGINSLIGLIMGRTDLSEFDLDKIVPQIQNLKDYLGEQTDKITTQLGNESPYNFLKKDIDDYLVKSYPWQIRQRSWQQKFRDILYNPKNDPETVVANLKHIDRAYFAEVIGKKGLYTKTQIESIGQFLDKIRLSVITDAETAIEHQQAQATVAKLEEYLLHTSLEHLTYNEIQAKFNSIFRDLNYEQLNESLARFDRADFANIFAKRQDIAVDDSTNPIDELEIAKELILQQAREERASAQLKAEVQWQRIQSYLRKSRKEELSPQAIQKELQSFLDDRQIDPTTRKVRQSLLDRDNLVSLLKQRQDLIPKHIERILEEVEKIWLPSESPKLVNQAQDSYERAKLSIADYLRNTGKEALNPEGIERDLTTLLDDPKTGFKAIASRLAEIDRDTLVHLLGQREDLSQEQVNQIIDRVRLTLGNIAQAPQSLARQTQEKVASFQETVAEYLRSTDKEELNPEGIKRDLKLLFDDPHTGMGNLQERLSHFDRETLVAILSQRKDISQEDANRIIDQIMVIREQMLERLQTVQITIERIIVSIRQYLSDIPLPELDYQSIKNELHNLFNDPKAGFEVLRDRFSHFDRDTLIDLLSYRDDISRADAERIVSQVETTRDRLLRRAERIQQEAKLHVDKVKRQAYQQAEEARKAAAVASWWLFFTAFISAIASASAGALGAI
jgi:hypothetical protein